MLGTFGDVGDLDRAPPGIPDQLEADRTSHTVSSGAGLKRPEKMERLLRVEILCGAAR